MGNITINTIDDAIELLKETSINWENVVVSNDLLKLTIKVEGDNYSQNLNAGILKGLLAYQEAIYRIYAVAKYGDTNLKRLSALEREQLTVWVKVSAGSSIFELGSKLIDFLRGAMADMTPKGKVITLVSVAITISGCYCLDGYFSYEKGMAKIEAEASKYEQLANITNALVQQNSKSKAIIEVAEESIANAQQQFVKNTPMARGITIGERKYNEEEIRAIQAPSKRVSGQWKEEEKDFIVTAINRDVAIEVIDPLTQDHIVLAWIVEPYYENQELFEEIQKDANAELQLLCDSLIQQSPIKLKISKHIKSSGEIDRYRLLEVIQP